MGIQVKENNKLIAERVPPGDKWSLVEGGGEVPYILEDKVYSSLTDALQAYFDKTNFKGSYKLDPLNSKLFAIETSEVEIKPKEEKTYSIYGEFKQGV